jgi:AmmeMemoRadiSam system protein B
MLHALLQKLIFFSIVCLGSDLCCDQTELQMTELKKNNKKVRSSSAKGIFYSKNPAELSNLIQKAFERVGHLSRIHNEQSLVLIVPHAGYRYCEAVYAAAYAQIQNQKFDHIVVVAAASQKLPSKHETAEKTGGTSVLWTSAINAWETPLGQVEVDPITQEIAREFNNPLVNHANLHEKETSIEIQLPWLQSALSDHSLRIVSILIDDLLASERLALTLYQMFKNKRVLYIVCTNFGINADEVLQKFPHMDGADLIRYLRTHADSFSSQEAVYMGVRLKELLKLPVFSVLAENVNPLMNSSYASLITAESLPQGVQTKS